ncbi:MULTISPECIES: FAD-binding oxidoreductase [unclassified Afipia]|nr:MULTISPECIES: FAD-binding oxidoreductase [unclassified Afipia]OUX58708.1 MAG: FAD-dependent oxidoreductase [Afipia sp. TMED4]
MMFDPERVRQNDLRGGTSPWSQRLVRPGRSSVDQDFRCEILVVGAGVTGSLVAEHLAAEGHEVCVIDRQRPGFGSTAASTAMLLWEIDRSLNDLTAMYGFDRAASIYRRSFGAVSGLAELVNTRGLACGLRHKRSLYLAAGNMGARELKAEHDLRMRAGLPGEYLDHLTLLEEFGLYREAALHSIGSADADPLLLCQALLAAAAMQGVRIFDASAENYDNSGQAVIVELDNGHIIEAKQVVLATGYVMPDFVSSSLHKISSSWAIATPPQPAGGLWRDGALIWEASENYSYARTTTDNRIIMGGEDDDQVIEPEARDRLMPAKSEALLHRLNGLWSHAEPVAEFVWSGAFGTTTDGLPLIGRVPGHPRIHAAYGYGGNGITYSYLASRIIAASIAGNYQPWFDDFAIDRDAPKTTP